MLFKQSFKTYVSLCCVLSKEDSETEACMKEMSARGPDFRRNNSANKIYNQKLTGKMWNTVVSKLSFPVQGKQQFSHIIIMFANVKTYLQTSAQHTSGIKMFCNVLIYRLQWRFYYLGSRLSQGDSAMFGLCQVQNVLFLVYQCFMIMLVILEVVQVSFFSPLWSFLVVNFLPPDVDLITNVA